MDCRRCFDRYLGNVPTKRLVIYGIIAFVVMVAAILLIMPSGETDEPQPKPEPSGRDILQTTPLVDGYNALPFELMDKLKGMVSTFPFDTDMSTGEKNAWCKTDLPRLQKGMVGTQVFTVKPSCDSQYKDAVAVTLQQIDALNRLLAMHPNEMRGITAADDISKIKEEGKVGVIIGLDGGHAIDSKLSTLRAYHSLGVRYLSLNSECSTIWSTSYKAKDADDNKSVSLSDFGKAVIKEMNRVGMIIDLSRSSKRTQLAVLDVSEAPVILTAAASYKLTPIAGNIEDDVLERLKANKGLIMVTFDAKSLSQNTNISTITLKNVASHINYFRQLVGVDNVGLAAGFHRSSSVPVGGLSDSSKYPVLFDYLSKAENSDPKWSPDDLKKLAGQNFIRVWQNVEEIRDKKASQDIPSELLVNPLDIPTDKKVCYSELYSL